MQTSCSQFDIARFVTLVCQNVNTPTSLCERFIKNYNALLNNDKGFTFYSISADEFDQLYNICFNAQEATLTGYVHFMQRLLSERSIDNHSQGPSNNSFKVHVADVVSNHSDSGSSVPYVDAVSQSQSKAEDDEQHIVEVQRSHDKELVPQHIAEMPLSAEDENVADVQTQNVEEEESIVGEQKMEASSNFISQTENQNNNDHKDQKDQKDQHHLGTEESENKQRLKDDDGSRKSDTKHQLNSLDKRVSFKKDMSEHSRKPSINSELPLKIDKSVVEKIIENHSEFPQIKKDKMKLALSKIYAEDVFDLEMSLGKIIGHYAKHRKIDVFTSYIQYIKSLLSEAHKNQSIELDYPNSRIKHLLSCAENGRQMISNEDKRSELPSVCPSWTELRNSVKSFATPILDAIRTDKSYLLETSDLVTCVRTMLYVCEQAPRRDEYRSLSIMQDSENFYSTKYGRIHLKNYHTASLYGDFEFDLSEDTADLLDELCRRKENDGISYVFGMKTDNSVVGYPTEDEWNDLCKRDFEKVCNISLDISGIRTLYLNDKTVRSTFEKKSLERIQTMINMGQTFNEHFTFLNINPISSRLETSTLQSQVNKNVKRRSDESVSQSIEKTRRIE